MQSSKSFQATEPKTVEPAKVYAVAGAAVLTVATFGLGGGILSWIASNKIKAAIIAALL